MHIPNLAFEPIDRSFFPPALKLLPRVQRRTAEVLVKGTEATPQTSPKSWELSFLKAPKSMDASGPSDHLTSVTFTNQAWAPNTDPLSKSASVIPTDETTTYPASLAFRSVGYKSTAIPGLSDLGVPFDAKLGIIPNDPHGRVLGTPPSGLTSDQAVPVPGVYCAGWVKRGPTGVIASTMADAFMSADIIAHDWESGAMFLNTEGGENKSTGLGWDALKKEVVQRGVRPVSWADWKSIDKLERGRGKHLGKAREKFVSVEAMMRFLDG
jgi:adrenodoxin-NADP+ reductase